MSQTEILKITDGNATNIKLSTIPVQIEINDKNEYVVVAPDANIRTEGELGFYSSEDYNINLLFIVVTDPTTQQKRWIQFPSINVKSNFNPVLLETTDINISQYDIENNQYSVTVDKSQLLDENGSYLIKVQPIGSNILQLQPIELFILNYHSDGDYENIKTILNSEQILDFSTGTFQTILQLQCKKEQIYFNIIRPQSLQNLELQPSVIQLNISRL